MEQQIQTLFEACETARREFMTTMADCNDAQLNYKSSEKAWSMLEVMHHLVTADTAILGYIRKKNQAESLPKSNLGTSLRSFTLNAFLKSPFRVRVPAGINKRGENLTLKGLSETWEKNRVEFQQFITDLPPGRLDRILFRHPFAGYFTLAHTLKFMRHHVERHHRQLKRVIGASGFPVK